MMPPWKQKQLAGLAAVPSPAVADICATSSARGMTLAKEGFPVLVAPSSVREYSAAEHLTVKDMLPAHRRILERIVSSIYAITAAELEPEGERRGESIRTRDPNLNFLIDGQRGSGKTSLLYTTHRFLNHLDYDSDRTLLDSVDPDSSLYLSLIHI